MLLPSLLRHEFNGWLNDAGAVALTPPSPPSPPALASRQVGAQPAVLAALQRRLLPPAAPRVQLRGAREGRPGLPEVGVEEPCVQH